MFLERIAANILDLGNELVDRASAETGLPKGRIEGERTRTVGQLRLFAAEVRKGRFQELRVDPAAPERKPQRSPISSCAMYHWGLSRSSAPPISRWLSQSQAETPRPHSLPDVP
jgi:hypothetical protein